LSRPYHGLLDNFLNILELFLAVESDCTKSLMENGLGEERKMYGEPAMPSRWQRERGS
jgi:hypothetical protein